MGGPNSGRSGGKTCTDDMRSLDVRRLHREGLLIAGNTFGRTWTHRGREVGSILINVEENHVQLCYRQSWRGGPWTDCVNTVMLDWSDCHFGGRRPWWFCPSCGCRVALLYSGRGRYACRHCFQLAYRSQRETQEDLAARRANRIRDRLGWPRGVLNPQGERPKGMHMSTYYRLLDQHNRHSMQAFAGIGRSLGLIHKRLEKIK